MGFGIYFHVFIEGFLELLLWIYLRCLGTSFHGFVRGVRVFMVMKLLEGFWEVWIFLEGFGISCYGFIRGAWGSLFMDLEEVFWDVQSWKYSSLGRCVVAPLIIPS